MSPLISCIVPVFNGEPYLGEALESILHQTYRPLEVIVVDDGSTDATAAVIASYGDQVRYLFQPNAGVAAACNLGVRASRGEFVAFLAADDLWHPEKLALQVFQFQDRPELDLCVTHMQNFWIPELRAAERGTVMELLPEVLVYRRLHRANISREKAIASPVELLQIVKASLNRRRRPGVASPQFLKLPGSGRGEKT